MGRNNSGPVAGKEEAARRSRQYDEYAQNEGRRLAYEVGDRWGTDLQGLVGNVRILNFIMAGGSH